MNRSLLPIGFALGIVPSLAAERPNIVWIIAEDMSAHFGCYGETAIATPHVDRMAREGVRFANAFVTSPVCSPARSALITGMHQSAIGAHHHQSSRSEHKIRLPEGVRPVPELFREAGYFVADDGKADYNFVWDPSMYSGKDWADRAEGQPFFAQVQLRGGKRRNDAPGWEPEDTVTPDRVKLPPYYPAHPVLLQDWADYLSSVIVTDNEVGRVLARLEAEGLADNTYVFFITDHGLSHARGKGFLYDEGIHIPFVVRGPVLEAGTVREDVIEHIDMAATSLALAGIPLPAQMQARDLFACDFKPRDAAFAARDRCDETVDRIRSVRTSRFKYIRNYFPARPHLQPSSYKDRKEIVKVIRELHADGKLTPAQQLIVAQSRSPEELYDLENDPSEVRNLAGDPGHQDNLLEMRRRLEAWIVETGDKGQTSEPAAVYDAEMEVYLSDKTDPDQVAQIRANIRQMKEWVREGK
jgi:arylsulfatase A-like enzyme